MSGAVDDGVYPSFATVGSNVGASYSVRTCARPVAPPRSAARTVDTRTVDDGHSESRTVNTRTLGQSTSKTWNVGQRQQGGGIYE